MLGIVARYHLLFLAACAMAVEVVPTLNKTKNRKRSGDFARFSNENFILISSTAIAAY